MEEEVLIVWKGSAYQVFLPEHSIHLTRDVPVPVSAELADELVNTLNSIEYFFPPEEEETVEETSEE